MARRSSLRQPAALVVAGVVAILVVGVGAVAFARFSRTPDVRVGVASQAVTGTVVAIATATATAESTGTMAADVAAALGAAIAQRGDPRLDGPPTEIRGRLMTLAEARAIDPFEVFDQQHGAWSRRNEPVWVIVLQGKIIDIKAGPGGPVMTQMVLVLDAKTGIVMEIQSRPRHVELPLTSWPRLTPRPGPLPALPTPVLSTAVPGRPKPSPPDRLPTPAPGVPTATPDPR